MATKLWRLIKGGYGINQILHRAYRSPFLPMPKARAFLDWFHASQKRSRKQLAGSLVLKDQQRALADQLRHEGHCSSTNLVSEQLAQRMIQEGNDLSNARPLRLEEGHGQHWQSLLTKANPKMDSAFVQFALQPAILEVIAAALGEVPRLIALNAARSWNFGVPKHLSQLWHRDFDDAEVVKLFCYLTDVDNEDDGPFTFIPANSSGRVGERGQNHLQDAQVFSQIPRDKMRTVLGPAGSSFIVRTSHCLHMGSRVAPDHSRILYSATYISAPSLFFKARPLVAPPVDAAELTRLVLS